VGAGQGASGFWRVGRARIRRGRAGRRVIRVGVGYPYMQDALTASEVGDFVPLPGQTRAAFVAFSKA
jgi:hypothetical protein